jgi:cytosine/adenosine deaminase-related metal-dependent hydrolase
VTVRFRAAWILPIHRPPIRNGWVDIEGGRIAAVGGPDVDATGGTDLGDVALIPGLVNAHTHLELSYLKDRVPGGAGFVSWIRGIIAARRQRPDPSAPEILESIERGIEQSIATGTALVGDISNTLVSFEPLARSRLAAVVFNEVIRFASGDAEPAVNDAVRRLDLLRPTEMVKPSLAAHAPYSVSRAAFEALHRAVGRQGLPALSVHLSESREEVEFVQTGEGPWRALLEEMGTWDTSWTPPAVSPVEYLDALGFLDSKVLAVHGVQMSTPDLARLRARGATLVACPRSNLHTGAGSPPIQAFYDSGAAVAVGTDSLASSPDLNVFAELAEMHRQAPAVPAARLLDSATRQGARALGFGHEFGTIEPGKRGRLLAVALPPRTDDVERYLVGGIEPEQLRWIP